MSDTYIVTLTLKATTSSKTDLERSIIQAVIMLDTVGQILESTVQTEEEAEPWL